MKTLAMMAMAVVMETGARATDLTVYVQGLSVVAAPVLCRAQALANEVFAGADVKIDWRRGQPSRFPSNGKAIVIEIVTGTPRGFKPGALAFALPYEGVHIQVL